MAGSAVGIPRPHPAADARDLLLTRVLQVLLELGRSISARDIYLDSRVALSTGSVGGLFIALIAASVVQVYHARSAGTATGGPTL
jgi:hypothetical protein